MSLKSSIMVCQCSIFHRSLIDEEAESSTFIIAIQCPEKTDIQAVDKQGICGIKDAITFHATVQILTEYFKIVIRTRLNR